MFCSIEIGGTLGEILTSYKSVAKWSKPERPPFAFNYFAMKPTIRKEPKGVVLILVPFNYPVLLAIGPLVRILQHPPLIWLTKSLRLARLQPGALV